MLNSLLYSPSFNCLSSAHQNRHFDETGCDKQSHRDIGGRLLSECWTLTHSALLQTPATIVLAGSENKNVQQQHKKQRILDWSHETTVANGQHGFLRFK